MSSKANPTKLHDQGKSSVHQEPLDAAGALDWLEQELDAKIATPAEQKSSQALPAGNPIEAEMPRKPVQVLEEAGPLAADKSTQYLIFELGSHSFALPVANLVEIGRPQNVTPLGNAPDWVLGFTKLHGESISIIDTRRFLGMEGKDNLRSGGLLVVRSLQEEVQVGLVVDDVREITYLPEAMESLQFDGGNPASPYVRRLVQRGSQSLNIVDPERLLSSSLRLFGTPAAPGPSAPATKELHGLARITDRVEETSRHVKRMAERSKEMTAIVQLIADIAEQTRILAMNSSIKAATAGESGRDFAFIAGEVERLADRSLYSSRQLLAVVESVQNESHDAVLELEATSKNVSVISESATRAGSCLSEIEAASHAFSGFVKTVSQAAQSQARSSETVTKALEDMLNSIRQMEQRTSQASDFAESLSALAGNLKASVSGLLLE